MRKEDKPEETASVSEPSRQAIDRVLSALTDAAVQKERLLEVSSTNSRLLADYGDMASALTRLEAQVAVTSKQQGEQAQANESRKRLFSRAIRAFAVSVLLLVLSNFATPYFQFKAEKSRQLFSAESDLYKSLLSNLGSIESDARKLQWAVADAESQGQSDLLEAQQRIFLEQAGNILERFQGLGFPPEWEESKEDSFAVQQPWYKIYALMSCLEKGSHAPLSPTRSVKAAVGQALRSGQLDKESAQKIIATAVETPPCASNFKPEVFQRLKARAARGEWEHLTNDPISRLF